MGPEPAVAAVRRAVRRALHAAPAGPVVVACSGGADSLALLQATLFECAPRARNRPDRTAREVHAVTVDHGLQEGSRARAERLVALMSGLGADRAQLLAVEVRPAGQGPEAAARAARYAALERYARQVGSQVVLLGHTRDDQAETVLLGLTRGSGARSLAGMPARSGLCHRPLLALTRAQTLAACRSAGLEVWQDPHNEDPRFTRSRLRHRVLPVLEAELGPGVTAALVRTADLLREDADALEGWTTTALAQVLDEAPTPDAVVLDVAGLTALPAAVRLRVLRRAALQAGAPAEGTFRVHVLALDALVTRWHGQGEVHLPGRCVARRSGGRLTVRGPAVAG